MDQLIAAHRAVGGGERGRRFEVEGLNRAAVLMLSAHFEGYIEDVMAEALGANNPQLGVKPLAGSFHNPWPHRIDDLFAFLGMSEPSKSISWQHAAAGAAEQRQVEQRERRAQEEREREAQDRLATRDSLRRQARGTAAVVAGTILSVIGGVSGC